MSGTLLVSPVCFTLQGRVSEDACGGDSSRYYNEAAGKCCYRCPECE